MDLAAWLIPGLWIGLTLALTALVARLASYLIGRVMRHSLPVAAVGARRLAATIVWIVGGTVALPYAGVSPIVLVLIVGLFGAAAILALRQPLENYGAKFFSDVYIPYKVGDTVRVGAVAGKVLEINAMATVLLSAEDQLVSVPNTVFLRETIVNTSPQAWKELTIPVSVGASVDLPAFESAVLKSLSKLRARLDPRFPPVLTTRARGPQGSDLVLTVMIRVPEDREALLGESTKRVQEVLAAFSATGRRVARP